MMENLSKYLEINDKKDLKMKELFNKCAKLALLTKAV